MKIDAAKFIADMIKVHGGECPKVWQDTLAMQGLKVENGEIVSIEPKFKVGDIVKHKLYGDDRFVIIGMKKDGLYVARFRGDDGTGAGESEKYLTLVERKEDYHLTGIGSKEATGKLKKMIDKVKQDEQNTDNLHQYLYGTLTEFEQCLKSGTNIYVEQGRHMEDWDAKSDAKELLEIARRTILAEAIELAYKTRDEMQYKDGFHDGYEEGFTDAMGAEYEDSL